jgi:DNA transposition AAA+ family ATPase
MKPKIALVKNIIALLAAYEALEGSEDDAPRMGLIEGRTGEGKTTAVGYLMDQTNAMMVRASTTWTKYTMLSAIMAEIGEAPLRRTADMEKAIIDHIEAGNRPLIIDEVDAFTDPAIRGDDGYAMLEILRTIHDQSGKPVILVGMSGIGKRIAARKQIMRRISQWVMFKPTDLADARAVAEAKCEVEVDDDLLQKALAASSGGIGLLVLALSKIERFGRNNKFKRVGMDQWGNRAFNLRGELDPRGNDEER